jgi:hypothetical protein
MANMTGKARVRPSEAPGACKHTEHHIVTLEDDTWAYDCLHCKSMWTMPVTDDDVPLVTALRGGRPPLRVVK